MLEQIHLHKSQLHNQPFWGSKVKGVDEKVQGKGRAEQECMEILNNISPIYIVDSFPNKFSPSPGMVDIF